MRSQEELLREALEHCAQEPIHIPGSIQSFGSLLVLDNAGRIVQAASSGKDVLNLTSKELLGLSLVDVLPDLAHEIVLSLSQQIKDCIEWRHWSKQLGATLILRLHANRSTGGLLEIIPDCNQIEKNNQKQSMLLQLQMLLAHTSKQEISLIEFCQNVVNSCREETGYDRVFVYRFDPYWHGEVIAESRIPELPEYLGLRFPASDIPPQARQLYVLNKIRVIADCDAPIIPLEPKYHPMTGADVDLSPCMVRSVSPVHLQYMRNMGTRASLVVSVMVGNQLWGMIACHHRKPRLPAQEHWQLVELFATALSLFIQTEQNKESQNAFYKAQRWISLVKKQIAAEPDWVSGLIKPEAGLLELVQADGVAVVRSDGVWQQGSTPNDEVCRSLTAWLTTRGEPFVVTDCLSSLEPSWAAYASVASGLLAVKAPNPMNCWILWFRGEQRQQVNWAGDPRKGLTIENGIVQLSPRTSFEAWLEEVAGHSIPWTDSQKTIGQESIRLNLLDILAEWQSRTVEQLEAIHRTLLEQIHEAAILLDKTGYVQFLNHSAEELFGWSSKLSLGEQFLNLHEPKVRIRMKQLLEQALKGQHIVVEWYHQQNTHNCWVELSMQRVLDNKRNFLGILVLARNITSRKEAEQALLDREQFLRQTIDRLITGVIVYRVDGTILAANQVACRLLHLNPNELIGRNLRREPFPLVDDKGRLLTNVPFLPTLALDFKTSLPEIEIGIWPQHCLLASWLLSRIDVECDSQGMVKGAIWSFTDVTSRRRTELALRENESLYRLLAENATDLILSIRSDNALAYVSPRSEMLLGKSAISLIGRSIESLIVPEDLPSWQSLVRVVRSSKTPQKLECRLQRQEGSIWVEIAVSFASRSTEQGELICVVRDIQDRRLAEETQRRLYKYQALGQLSGAVAHDFNNLLTVILALCSDKTNGEFEMIRNAAERGRQLTRQLLAFSRTERSTTEPLLIDDVVRGILPLMGKLLGVNVAISSQLNAPNIYILADRGQLEQALLNLAVNARDAMKGKGNLIIQTEKDQAVTKSSTLHDSQFVTIRVRDDGCGMDAATKSHIFEPFFTTKPLGQGTGLGLTVVQKVVTDAGGTISVESAVGQGTTFTLAFPIHQIKSQTSEFETKSLKPSASGHGQRIILVEDNPELRNLIAHVLQSAGYVPLVADSAEMALSLLTTEEAIDAMLTDVVMPGKSGIELCKEVAIRRPDLKLLLMSGFTDQISQPEDYAKYAKGYIQKPFRPDELIQFINQALHEKSSSS